MQHEINQEEYDALLSSIDDRWAFLAKGEDPITHTCPLCELHSYCDGYDDDPCIIYRDTDEEQCRGTEYYKWRGHLRYGNSMYYNPAAMQYASNMLDYLKDLKARCVVK